MADFPIHVQTDGDGLDKLKFAKKCLRYHGKIVVTGKNDGINSEVNIVNVVLSSIRQIDTAAFLTSIEIFDKGSGPSVIMFLARQ